MVSYVDSSALFKLYVPEIGSLWMAQVVKPDGIAISALMITEVGVSLSRLERNALLGPAEARDAWRHFRRDLRSFVVYPLARASLVAAAMIAARIDPPLRTLDAIQLRGAVEAAADARRSSQEPLIFLSADDRLLAAARHRGFATDNPLLHT